MLAAEYGRVFFHPRYYRRRGIRRRYVPHIFRRRRRIGLRRGFVIGARRFMPTRRYVSKYMKSPYPVSSVLMIRPVMFRRYATPRRRRVFYTYRRGRQFLM